MKNVRTNIHNLPDKSCISFCSANIAQILLVFFVLFEREFQFIASALDDSSLSSSQDTNQFFV